MKRAPSTGTSAVHAQAATGASFDVTKLGRFAEPRLRRALETLTDPTEVAYATGLLDTAHAMP